MPKSKRSGKDARNFVLKTNRAPELRTLAMCLSAKAQPCKFYIKIFQLISIQDYDEGRDVYEQNIYINLDYFGRHQQYHVLLKIMDVSTGKNEADDDEDGPENNDLHMVPRVFIFYELFYKGWIMQLALVQTYLYLRKKKHPSGSRVLNVPEKMYKATDI